MIRRQPSSATAVSIECRPFRAGRGSARREKNGCHRLQAMTGVDVRAPTLISAFCGMNVPLPLQDWRFAAPLIFIVPVVVALLVARVFVR
jgi:hypothetical protein